MENVVIPIFCVTSCQASDEQQPKLQKVCSTSNGVCMDEPSPKNYMAIVHIIRVIFHWVRCVVCGGIIVRYKFFHWLFRIGWRGDLE